MKYKLINNKTKEEHLCEKVTIDGFDYYVSDETVENYCWYINTYINKLYHSSTLKPNENSKKIIATNNPNIDIPKVVDEVEIKVDEILNKELPNFTPYHRRSFFLGYNKSQETHPFSDEDMIEFANWVQTNYYCVEINIWLKEGNYYTTKELLQLWKEQKLKTLYYE